MPRLRFDTPSNLAAFGKLRNVLSAREPDAWFTADEAAVYLGRARRTVRNLVWRGALVPDGRGPYRVPIFRKRTLDAYLAGGTP